ncbi:hypothetical protein, partial [Microbacterium sp.]|uniref:hypothetical protein n=1 Tax=Microbacterium sp. TaxID=51671 RepID=UPI0037366548
TRGVAWCGVAWRGFEFARFAFGAVRGRDEWLTLMVHVSRETARQPGQLGCPPDSIQATPPLRTMFHVKRIFDHASSAALLR